jgi:hypothetical protein
MRNISFIDWRLSVSDDASNVIRDLLEYALSPPYLNQLEELFSPDGRGISVPNCISCFRVSDVKDDFPEYMWIEQPFELEKDEIWAIYRVNYGAPGPHFSWIKGDELRYLIQESQRLSKQGELEFEAKYSRPFTVGAFYELKQAGLV